MSGTVATNVERALEAIRNGRMVVLVDDEDRENEGDLVLAAEKVTPEAINFMAKEARGLICLSLTEEWVNRLALPMMVQDNGSPRGTAFTVSIEARDGVTTGISAADRAHTIATAVDPASGPADLVQPGHVFPLRARDGGVLTRAGHTEGSVDLARLAGLRPAAVICEIMREDGTMARYGDLRAFCDVHGLPFVSVAELAEYRLVHEGLVRRVATQEVQVRSGHAWTAHLFENTVDSRHFAALVHGGTHRSAHVPWVRVHRGNVFRDTFGVSSHSTSVDRAMAMIEARGSGAVVYLPDEPGLKRQFMAQLTPAQDGGREPMDELREYGLGAQILRDLGLLRFEVITSNPRRLVGVEGFGIHIEGHVLP